MAKLLIHDILSMPNTVLVSGHSSMGGVDIWAEDIAKSMGIPSIIHPPKEDNWSRGYRPRNLLIARDGDEFHVIVVRKYPDRYTGRRFTVKDTQTGEILPFCYHCKVMDHVKSGACWTANKGISQGKKGTWHIIPDVGPVVTLQRYPPENAKPLGAYLE